jgi:hypothetical protein
MFVTALCLHYRSRRVGRYPDEPELFGGLFLLAGEKALQVSRPFHFAALYFKLQEDFEGVETKRTSTTTAILLWRSLNDLFARFGKKDTGTN